MLLLFLILLSVKKIIQTTLIIRLEKTQLSPTKYEQVIYHWAKLFRFFLLLLAVLKSKINDVLSTLPCL